MYSGHWAEDELTQAQAAGVAYVVLAEPVPQGIALTVIQTADRLVTLTVTYATAGFDLTEATTELARFGFTVTSWTARGTETGRHTARAVHDRRREW
ncbi:hypothetical protein OG435_48715 [Streptomyces sp. NBC_01264]|nr:hypothetical protein [Streptomyces sp. NBC_01264]